VICEDTDEQAYDRLRTIIENADQDAINWISKEKDDRGMWKDVDFLNLIDSNAGFRTGLIGSPVRVAEQIQALEAIGIDLILMQMVPLNQKLREFIDKVLPLLGRQRIEMSTQRFQNEYQ
jgi:FMNH2-dependent dimethyl sulfone monooxygenase